MSLKTFWLTPRPRLHSEALCVSLIDPKSTQGAALRQQGFHDVNKRRAFLQDNSWIKKLPEEEK